jgi:beta-1,2-mannosidase
VSEKMPGNQVGDGRGPGVASKLKPAGPKTLRPGALMFWPSMWFRLAQISGIGIFALAVLAAPSKHIPPFAHWTRLSPKPILSPLGDSFESAGVFNPAVIKRGNEFVMLYRAQDKVGTSRLGYATSKDGIHFSARAEPVLVPETAYEKDGGVEDPRLVQIGDIYYLTYTGYNKRDAQLCLATSRDLNHWERKGVLLPAYKGTWNVRWTKSGAIVPEKINGKYWMYYLGTTPDNNDQMGVAYSTDLLHWSDGLDRPVLSARAGQFDSRVVEPGPPPVITADGIFLIYNGADDKLIYRAGWVLFDKTNPTRVLARSDEPLFWPEEEWEKTGQVPNVVFVEGMVREADRWLFYYGGADKYVGVASAKLVAH